MGFELGPGFLRKAPKGWIPAEALALRHRINRRDYSSPEGGGQVLDSSLPLEVTWRVTADGGVSYEFAEERRAPTWVEGGGVGGGSRWYKVRVRPQFGLLANVPLPCAVNPDDRHDMWVDWDGAFERMEPAWDQRARVEREIARRSGTFERVTERVTNPLAGKLQPEDEAVVEQTLEARAQRQAELLEQIRPQQEAQLAKYGFGPVSEDERAEYEHRRANETRIYETGRPARATVVAQQDTGRTLANVPVIVITMDVADGGGAVRRVEYQHIWGPRHAKRYKSGKRIEVRIDPNNPGAVALGS